MSPTPTPPRRFQPEPIESTTTKKVRRFAVEPVETSTKSSKKPVQQPAEAICHASRIPDSQSPGTSTEPSTDKTSEPVKRPIRRFAPQPVETSTKKSGGQTQRGNGNINAPVQSDGATKVSSTGRRRFAPEPVETTTRSSRASEDSSTSAEDLVPLLPHERMSLSSSASSVTDAAKKPTRRKFAPQLIETAKRSHKIGDTGPAVLASDRTNMSPQDKPVNRRARVDSSQTSLNTPIRPTDGSFLRQDLTKQGTTQLHYNIRSNTRKHSFKVPSLPSIDSSESEESIIPSRTHSRDGNESDTSDEAYKDATRIRESVDDRFSGYLLALAARAAEKQLRDQAASAFINSDYHEPVNHYMNGSESEDDTAEPTPRLDGRPDPTRRDSEDEKWALREMQRHGARLQSEGPSTNGKSVAFDVALDGHTSKPDAWSSKPPGGPFDSAHIRPKNMIGGNQRDPDLRQMRKAASPPMLGGDIDFPRCASPDHARFDVTQGADFLRKQMCYLTQDVTEDKTGLWAKKSFVPLDHAGSKGDSQTLALKSSRSRSPPPVSKSSGTGGGGLWGGLCTHSDAHIPEISPGLMTPLRTPLATPVKEKEDPFAKFSITGSNSSAPALPSGRIPALATGSRTPLVPPSPPSSVMSKSPSFAAAIDARFELEAQIDADFNDAFVTQVYNYLSLGYPSLARKFDEELSRITKVPVDELRMDDKVAEVRGHVRLGQDGTDAEDKGLDETTCRRWRALRRYVREWARQTIKREKEEGDHPKPVIDPMRAWGQPGRRGSWGL